MRSVASKRLLLAACVGLFGCSQPPTSSTSDATNGHPAKTQQDSGEVEQAPSAPEVPAPGKLLQATYFVNPAYSDRPVDFVRENMEPTVNIGDHYSLAVVGCGTPCVSFWIVDRNDGAILDMPAGLMKYHAVYNDAVYDVKGRKGSDIVEIAYGNWDLESETCTIRKFRLSGHNFVEIGRKTSPCPSG